ncbi:MAG TPA: hypothetical protein VGR14_14275 [Verrucomicrobiae bacterium]|jgi:hypothetical protein|nr:hypothetical protein [Verrucomicrobiae bacterium]
MKMPPEILTFLLRGGHLNVPDRKAKGLWPNERLRYTEVVDHLVGVIQSEEWFPKVMPPHKEGDLVYEGTVIQRISPCRFVCHSRRPSVYNLCLVAEDNRKEFNDARKAAELYLKWELHLPGRLDSWIVE